MRQSDLQVNFFEVPLPDKPFGLWIRSLSQSEILNPFERLWESDSHGIRSAVLVAPKADTSTYTEKNIAYMNMPPFLVQALLEQGLKVALVETGKDIDQTLTSFAAFDTSDTISTDETFLVLRKGVQFHSDYISSERRHTFGFFASLKVRLKFTIDLSDPVLTEAAKRREIYIDDGAQHLKRTLMDVDSRTSTALLYDQQSGLTRDVELCNIRVPVTRLILAKYCELLGKPRGLPSQLIHKAQEASFRVTPSGSKNRSWLKSELAFVRAWLLRASPSGRLTFQLPNTHLDVYLFPEPATARFTEK